MTTDSLAHSSTFGLLSHHLKNFNSQPERKTGKSLPMYLDLFTGVKMP